MSPRSLIRTILADDEELARLRVRDLLAEESDICLIGECGDGNALTDMVRQLRPDLLILDVQMPESGGFEALARLDRESSPLVIFLTAHAHYAVDAFEHRAIDYLLKPVSRERFRDSLARIRNILRTEKEPRTDSGSRRIAVRSGSRVILLATGEIEAIEAAENYVDVHTVERSLLVRHTLMAMEKKLPGNQFVRIQRSAIVNLDHVLGLEPSGKGDYVVVLRSGRRIPLTRMYRPNVNALLAGL